MESKPGLLGSETGDPEISCSVQVAPETVSVTIAIPEGLPNSATYTPLPLPVWLTSASPAR